MVGTSKAGTEVRREAVDAARASMRQSLQESAFQGR
jgi:hypothetical protein